MSAAADSGSALLDVYDEALPQVYGYLLPRCSDPVLAQDLTAATFLAAVGKHPEPLTVGWLIGVARHKLVDHWRRREREERALRRVGTSLAEETDPWDEALDAVLAHQVLATLGPTTGQRSRCATSTGCRSARSPRTCSAPSTAPRRCSCAPVPHSAPPTRLREARDD